MQRRLHFVEHPGRVGTIIVVGGTARLQGHSPLGRGGGPRVRPDEFQNSVNSLSVTKTDQLTLKKEPRQTYGLIKWAKTESCDVEEAARGKRSISPVTGLEWPRGFQEVKVPRLRENGTGWW